MLPLKIQQIQHPDQNLLQGTPVNRLRRPRGFYYALVLDFLTLLGAVGTGFYLALFISGAGSIVSLLIPFVFFAAISVFQVLLFDSWGRRLPVLFLEALFLTLFLYLDQRLTFQFFVITSGAVFAVMGLGEWLSQAQIENSLRLRFFFAVKPQVSKLITAVTLLGVVGYLPIWTPEKAFLSKETFASFFDQAAQLSQRVYGEVKLDSTVQEFALSITRFKYQNEPQYKELAPTAQGQLVEKAATQLLSSLKQSLNLEIDPAQPVSSVLYEWLLVFLGKWQSQLQSWFLVIWAVLVFFAFRSIGVIVSGIVFGLAFFLYQFFLALDVIRLIGEAHTKEVVQYS